MDWRDIIAAGQETYILFGPDLCQHCRSQL